MKSQSPLKSQKGFYSHRSDGGDCYYDDYDLSSCTQHRWG